MFVNTGGGGEGGGRSGTDTSSFHARVCIEGWGRGGGINPLPLIVPDTGGGGGIWPGWGGGGGDDVCLGRMDGTHCMCVCK